MPHVTHRRGKFPPQGMALALGLALGCGGRADAGVDDLWVTEVVPGTGQVEVTNVGTDPVTITVGFRWCHRFSYAGVVGADTVVAPGESRFFTVAGLNADVSDLWLYRSGAFGGTAGEASIVGGVKYGAATSVGREGVATNAGIWDGVGSFAALPPTVPPFAQSLQVTGPNPFAAVHWTLGTPNLGSFPRPAFAISGISRPEPGMVTVEWEGGAPPFQVQSSTDLDPGGWQNLGPRTGANSATLPASGDRRFFRVLTGLPAETATYDVTFAATWTAGTHPDFPAGAHFSGLIGGTHGNGASFWEPGSLASPGIKGMAETGSKAALTAEVNAAITAGTAASLLSGGGLASTPASVTLRFTLRHDFPLVTLVSMIAPSPDWFVGVRGMSLLVDDRWADAATVELFPYDAGTDSGANFTAPNAATTPPVPVFRITGPPLGTEGEVAPFGTFRFVRVP